MELGNEKTGRGASLVAHLVQRGVRGPARGDLPLTSDIGSLRALAVIHVCLERELAAAQAEVSGTATLRPPDGRSPAARVFGPKVPTASAH